MTEKKRGPGRPPGTKNKNSTNSSTKKNNESSASKAKEKAKEIQQRKRADQRVMDEIWAIVTIAIGVFLAVAILTDGAGKLGDLVDIGLKGLFGHMAYALPFYLAIFGILLFARRTVHVSLQSFSLLLIVLFMLCTMNSIRFIDENHLNLSWQLMKNYYINGQTLMDGGFFGMILANLLIKWLGKAGCWIFTVVVIIICLLLLINTPISRFISKIGEKNEERKLIKENAHLDQEAEEIQIEKSRNNKYGRQKMEASDIESLPKTQLAVSAEETKKKKEYKIVNNSILKYMNDDNLFNREGSGTVGLEEQRGQASGYGIEDVDSTSVKNGLQSASRAQKKTEVITNEIISPLETPAKEVPEKISNQEAKEAMLTTEDLQQSQLIKEYQKPSIELLEKSSNQNRTNHQLLTAKAEKLEETLKNFHVDARVVQVTQGPTVTRYEIQPSVGVKVNSIVRLADDIALNLEAKSIRIEAPIPGKAAVGIEVENESVSMVRIREIIDSENFKRSKSKITFAVGKDISGQAIVADLKAMPHLLIAGSTGSGKSVCINSIITSFVYKADPKEVKLILIDPKVVELGNYNGIPHLLIPVVTDPSKAAAALNWAVAEMTERYKKFAEEGVRDLESYNEAQISNDQKDNILPQIVIIIDELADLMMVAPSQIEESICRLAQMARAAGMHLIVATQRPSVDVITGVIKANIPSRIAFAVSSQVDSRTILDMQGAEKLVGKGDMLFSPMGMGKPIRVQGTFISDNEVHKVIEHVKQQIAETAPAYNEDVLSRIEKTNSSESIDDGDDLLSDAIELVVRSGQASVSMLQRRFRIGYNRAARIVDMMEARGIIGPQDGSRPRQVLMTEEEFEQMESEVMNE